MSRAQRGLGRELTLIYNETPANRFERDPDPHPIMAPDLAPTETRSGSFLMMESWMSIAKQCNTILSYGCVEAPTYGVNWRLIVYISVDMTFMMGHGSACSTFLAWGQRVNSHEPLKSRFWNGEVYPATCQSLFTSDRYTRVLLTVRNWASVSNLIIQDCQV